MGLESPLTVLKVCSDSVNDMVANININAYISLLITFINEEIIAKKNLIDAKNERKEQERDSLVPRYFLRVCLLWCSTSFEFS